MKPVPLHADVRPPSPAKPGKPAKQDNEYERRGTANVFGAVESKTGRHFTTAAPDRSGGEFARLVERVVEQYPGAQTIHLSWITSIATCASPWSSVSARSRADTSGSGQVGRTAFTNGMPLGATGQLRLACCRRLFQQLPNVL
jgi:hypothetical protein